VWAPTHAAEQPRALSVRALRSDDVLQLAPAANKGATMWQMMMIAKYVWAPQGVAVLLLAPIVQQELTMWLTVMIALFVEVTRGVAVPRLALIAL